MKPLGYHADRQEPFPSIVVAFRVKKTIQRPVVLQFGR